MAEKFRKLEDFNKCEEELCNLMASIAMRSEFVTYSNQENNRSHLLEISEMSRNAITKVKELKKIFSELND